MEASGGFEQDAFLVLWEQGLPCAIANPRAVRKFAEAMGDLEKTDRIDAEMIAGYALAKRIVPTPPPSAAQQRLTALVTRLRQVTEDLGVQKQRVHSTREATALESLKEVIAFFTAQAKRLEAEMVTLIDADPLWTALDRSFRSIKGVADRTVAHLLAELPEIGTISNSAITKLVGLAPLADDSGKRKGNDPSAAAAPASARSSSSSPMLLENTTQRSPPSASGCSPKAAARCKCASHSRESSSFDSMPKRAMPEPSSHMQL